MKKKLFKNLVEGLQDIKKFQDGKLDLKTEVLDAKQEVNEIGLTREEMDRWYDDIMKKVFIDEAQRLLDKHKDKDLESKILSKTKASKLSELGEESLKAIIFMLTGL